MRGAGGAGGRAATGAAGAELAAGAEEIAGGAGGRNGGVEMAAGEDTAGDGAAGIAATGLGGATEAEGGGAAAAGGGTVTGFTAGGATTGRLTGTGGATTGLSTEGCVAGVCATGGCATGGTIGRGGTGGGAITSFFWVIALNTSPGREMCDRSIFVLISSSPRGPRALDLPAEDEPSAEERMYALTFSASCSSRELECVFFSVTPTSASVSRMALLLTSSSRARSLIRTLLIRPFVSPCCS